MQTKDNDSAQGQQKTAEATEVTEISSKGTGFLNTVRSVFAAMFGVQSHDNQERDFAQGRASDYIVVGIVVVIMLIIGMILVVKSVLSSAGA